MALNLLLAQLAQWSNRVPAIDRVKTKLGNAAAFLNDQNRLIAAIACFVGYILAVFDQRTNLHCCYGTKASSQTVGSIANPGSNHLG